MGRRHLSLGESYMEKNIPETVDCLCEVHNIVQEAEIKSSLRIRCKKAKWLSEEALQIAEKRRKHKVKAEKERYTHLNAEFQRVARRDRKDFLRDKCKEMNTI